MKNSVRLLSVAIVAGAIGYLAANFIPVEHDGMQDPMVSTQEAQPLYWVAPMDSSFRRDAPGLSPMGMDLIPVYEEPDGDTNAVRVNSTVQHNLGLRTAKAIRSDFARDVEAVGYTRWNEATIEMLHPRAEGWLEVFNLDSVGDQVEAGQVIYELYAPNLVSAQQEFITARQARNETLAALARERLLALGFTPAQVDELANNGNTSSRLVYRAVNDALVVALGTRRGNYVQPASTIATLASLDSIWVDVDIFETDTADLEIGLEAAIEFPAFPGETWTGEVSYIYPELERSSRTLRVRLVIENEGHRLKPNMFANVAIATDPRLDVLAVPREAVIRSGSGSRLIVVRDDGGFEPRAVRTGVSSGERIEILQGLSAGETVVTSGQFLIDAEANGEQALARLDAASESTSESMDMDMDMDMERSANLSGDQEAVYSTTGRIASMMNDGMVTLAHQPVAALGWPAMTMSFTTVPEVNLSDFTVDDTVRFEFRQLEGGGYEILVMEEAEVMQ
ncbi:MAG: efflux RND transporter periplasmic adaptor subunit [Gammaproteobacteria bacterium]